MADGPDVRALAWVLDGTRGAARPRSCFGCPFGTQPVDPRFVACALLGLTPVEKERPACTPGHWRDRARTELAALTSDNALLTAVARDAREESSMYNRGLAEGRAAEREGCAKAVCGRCAAGDPAVLHHGVWCHQSLTHGAALVGPCKADAIRRRAGEDGR